MFGGIILTEVKTEKKKSLQKHLPKLVILILVIPVISISTIILIVNNKTSSYVNEEIYKMGITHINKLDNYNMSSEEEKILIEVANFKNSFNLNELKGNDREFVQAIINIDKLYNKEFISSTFNNISDPLDRKQVAITLALMKIEGQKFIKNKDMYNIREFNDNFDSIISFIREEYTDKLQIVSGWKWIVDGNYSYIRGRVKNISDVTVSYFEITAEYLDISGNVLDSDYTNSGLDLKPGNQKEFEIMHRHSDEYKSVRIFISKVDY